MMDGKEGRDVKPRHIIISLQGFETFHTVWSFKTIRRGKEEEATRYRDDYHQSKHERVKERHISYHS